MASTRVRKALPVTSTTSIAATTNSTAVVPGMPNSRANGANGVSMAVWASRPQGKPLNGMLPRAVSPSTHTAAPHSGQNRSRQAARRASMTTAKNTVSASTSATYAPLLTAFIHQISGPMNASPNSAPMPRTTRLRASASRCATTTRPATPATIAYGTADRVEPQ